VNVPEFLHESRDIKLFCSINRERREVTAEQPLQAYAPLAQEVRLELTVSEPAGEMPGRFESDGGYWT